MPATREHGATLDSGPRVPEGSVMTDEPVLFSHSRGVTSIRLNRPEVANSLDLATARRFRDGVLELSAARDVSIVVLSAAGKYFCAGGDVAAMHAASDRKKFVYQLASTVHQGLEALRALPVPVIAAVQGLAAGAGVGLVLAADIAIASDRAKFVSAYGIVGLTPDCGVSALLVRTVGARRAARFVLSGEPLDAQRALEWGLTTEVCTPDDLESSVSSTVAALLERPAAAVGMSALLLRRAAERSYAEQLGDEAATIAQMAARQDTASLLARFVESRNATQS